MSHDYLSHIRSGSSWLIAHPDDMSRSLSFHTLEAGKFLLDTVCGDIHCGKDGYMLLYSHSGEGELSYNGQNYRIPALTITLVDCSRPYRMRAAPGFSGVWTYYWMRFDGPGCGFVYETLFSDEYVIFGAEPTRIKEEFDMI
ncbi:MAG: AraC family ligand binding domain-containing protein, partial [Oscillospiraceae bacterium]|nr:AraC family ligand binding domain-containing protein [Oscillospiraceae bacterium]